MQPKYNLLDLLYKADSICLTVFLTYLNGREACGLLSLADLVHLLLEDHSLVGEVLQTLGALLGPLMCLPQLSERKPDW